MEKLIYDTFSALDGTGRNTDRYKKMFSSMSDTQFDKFFKELFNNQNAYLILNLCDYEIDLKIEDIKKAADVLGIPLFEKIAFTHFTMDKNKPVVTKEPVPVGYCHVKRTQQTLAKKNVHIQYRQNKGGDLEWQQRWSQTYRGTLYMMGPAYVP